MPTIPQTQTILYSYFNTGDAPTQNQFQEFIGTMFYLFNESVNSASAAATSASAAAASAASVVGAKCAFTISGATATLHGANNINVASIVRQSAVSGGAIWRFTFTTAFADQYFKAIPEAFGASTAYINDVDTSAFTYVDVFLPTGTAQGTMVVFA